MDAITVKTLVVDDQPAAGLFLKAILEQVPGVVVAEVVTNSLDVVRQVELHQAQVVFLDIDMPDLNGLELARILRDKYANLCLVFATAHGDYALEAFELYSFDYILKPFHEERIIKTMQKIKERFERVEACGDDFLIIAETGRQVVLRPGEIIYIEIRKHKILIKTNHDNELVINADIRSFEKRLPGSRFFRCHRSFLVNTSYIKMIARFGHSYDIVLHSGERIPLSRRQLAELKNHMQRRP